MTSPEISEKTKLETSSDRINPLAEHIDEFIDKLAPGEETVLPISNLANFTVMNALHQELESREFPPIELMTFDRNPSQWPEFIADFKESVYLKQAFSDQMQMERLLNVLRHKTISRKQSIKFLCCCISHQNDILQMHFVFSHKIK